MTEIPQEIQDMFDTHPEEEELKDFDSFLIGDGSASLMERLGKPKKGRNFQLTGIATIEDLDKVQKDEYNNDVTDDMADYTTHLDIADSILEYYFKVKRSSFNTYDFLAIKSKKYSGRPLKELDLVVSDNEKYMLKYLEGNGLCDYGLINSLAQVRALEEMGFLEAKFSQLDCCPLCEAYDGNVYSLTQIAELLGSGQHLVHGNCIGKFTPVMRDRSRITEELVIDHESMYIGDVKFNNLPIEYTEELYSLAPTVGASEVSFVDLTIEPDYDREFVREVDGALYIHNGYYGNYSPIDFLRGWAECQDLEEGVSEDIDKCVESGDVYYLNGRKVVEVDGIYFDVETQKQVK